MQTGGDHSASSGSDRFKGADMVYVIAQVSRSAGVSSMQCQESGSAQVTGHVWCADVGKNTAGMMIRGAPPTIVALPL